MPDIPTVQTVAWVENPGKDGYLIIRHDVAVAKPGDGEVLVKLECSGICHSDCRNVSGMGIYTAIPGHEGVGNVIRVGRSVPDSLLGQRVGIKWVWSSCMNCAVCKSGNINNCPSQMNTGRSVLGTLQQYVIAKAEFVTHIPDGLPSEIAAPLLCAGLAIAGAVSKCEPELQSGDWVAIVGAGGGLGHLGVQIAANSKGYKVIAIDSGSDKRQLCLDIGASAFMDYATEDVENKVKKLTDGEGAHAVIIVAGSEKAYEKAPDLVRNTGVIICVGLPRGDFHLPISPIQIASRG